MSRVSSAAASPNRAPPVDHPKDQPDAKRFTVYFEGQEIDRYETFTGALSGTIHASQSVNLKFIGSVYDLGGRKATVSR